MIRMLGLVRFALECKTYIWIDVVLVRETPKAVLILFDGRKVWIPKAWIMRIKQIRGKSIRIRISEYYWAKKFV